MGNVPTTLIITVYKMFDLSKYRLCSIKMYFENVYCYYLIYIVFMLLENDMRNLVIYVIQHIPIA